MKILAVELSSDLGSMALIENGLVRLSKEWKAERHHGRPIFADLMQWVQTGVVGFGNMDFLAVGVGPGSFSGLRAAVSLMHGLALPGKTPVMAVSSARALAAQLLKETGAPQVVVFGDARRNELWAGCFTDHAGIVTRRGDWSVAPMASMPQGFGTPGTVWVSAEWDRLEPVVMNGCPAGVKVIRQVRRPNASMVAELAEALVSHGVDGEQAIPVYLHPAVSIAPRF